MVGLPVIIAILAVQFEYRNHAVFASLILILIGLHNKKHGLVLLRLQVAIIYFGGGLNKLLDPDWLNGQFFEFWTRERLKHEPYMLISSYFPPMMLSRLFSWITIFLELSVALGFLIPRFYSLSIWLGVLLHGSIMIFTVDSGNLSGLYVYFLPAAIASYLVFYKWPETTGHMQYDLKNVFSLWLKKVSGRIDHDQFFTWEPFSKSLIEGKSRPYLQLQTDAKTYVNFKAVKVFLLLNPLTYAAIFIGFLFIARMFPYAVGLIWDSRYIPFGALIKTVYFMLPVIIFFPFFEFVFEFLITKGGRGKQLL